MQDDKTRIETLNAIEAMVDKEGLFSVVQCLEQMCYAKAEHIASNWQDANTARHWEQAGEAFDKLSSRIHSGL